MNERKRILIVAVFLLGAVIIWFWPRHNSAGQSGSEPFSVATNPASETTSYTSFSTRSNQPIPVTTQGGTPKPESNPAAWIEHRRQQMEEDRQRGLNEWRTPIEFYGKVIDENTNSVAGAQVDFDCNDLSAAGTSYYHTQSDADGLFSIQDINGKLLGVKVSKSNYYSYQPHGLDFYYAGQNQNFVPDVMNPIIFRLKKKGIAEPLIVFEKNFQISVSGKPLEIDLKTGMTVSPGKGNIIAEFVKQQPQNPNDRLYDWSFKITVPNGGLTQSTSEFDFSAPASGYEPSDSVEMKSSLGQNWQSRMKRQYFLRLPDGKYARVILDLMSHNGSLKVQSFINPSGSPNLEYDPNDVVPLGQ
jgi:hypothetical protein